MHQFAGLPEPAEVVSKRFPVRDSRLTFTAWKKLTTSRTNDR
jgi:hypothetical protein